MLIELVAPSVMEESVDSFTGNCGKELDEPQRKDKKLKRQLSVKNEAMAEEGTSSQQIYTGEGEEESDLNRFFVLYSPTANRSKSQAGGDRPRAVVDVPENRCRQIWKPWRRAFIIKVLGMNMDFEMMQQKISDLWSHIKGFELVELEYGYLIVRFYSRVDYEWISKNGPWMILGHYLMLSPWRPYFVPSQRSVRLLSVWVRVLKPPIEFFYEDILLQIGNVLGVATKIDENFPLKRSYARICVKVDLQKPLVPIVEVNGLELKVGYEGLHDICFECGKYGHKLEKCPTRDSSKNALMPPNVTSPFGPWMVVSN